MKSPRPTLDFGPAEPFTRTPLSFLESPAYRALRLYERKFLDGIQAEWSRDMYGNGRITLSNRHLLTMTGLTGYQHAIDAIATLSALGIIRVVTKPRVSTTYTITFLPTPDAPPTHDWRQVTDDEHARSLVVRAERKAKKANAKLAKRLGLQVVS